MCTAQCERQFTVHIAPAGIGAPCAVADGFSEVCLPDMVCDDGDDRTMDDVCSETRACEGNVILAAQLTYGTLHEAPAHCCKN
jgi:hypothetical protein